MTSRLDIIIFGATGFTGLHTIPYVHELSKAKGRNLSWGVSGRSQDKLAKIMEETGNKLKTDLSKIPIIIADISNDVSLKEMASKARIVINCCGPYRFLGEPVVKACVAAGTHYVDFSGEPQFIESMQLKYNEKAQEKGIYMVSACGMDCIPAEMGLVFMEKEFTGTLNQVETYLDIYIDHPKDGPKFEGPVLNYGTWQSLVHGVSNVKSLKDLRLQGGRKLPSLKPKLESKKAPHISPIESRWAIPFLGADKSVMRTSQYLFYKEEKKRPIQVATYLLLANFFSLFTFAFYGIIFGILSRFQFGCNLLLQYPSFFSGGMCTKETPSEKLIDNTWVELILIGRGWQEKLLAAEDNYNQPMDRCILVKVKGRNPGYGSTCCAVTLCAIKILTEADKLPPKGGVYPPAYAFAKTGLIEELHEYGQYGFTFEVIDKKLSSKL